MRQSDRLLSVRLSVSRSRGWSEETHRQYEAHWASTKEGLTELTFSRTHTRDHFPPEGKLELLALIFDLVQAPYALLNRECVPSSGFVRIQCVVMFANCVEKKVGNNV